MRWRESYPGRILTAISKYGLRAGLQDSFARWSRQALHMAHNVLEDYGWVLNEDRPAALLPPASGPLRINWLIPNITVASGGFLGIFRAIYYLERWGHKQHIYVAGRTRLSAAEATERMRKHYFPIQTEVELFSGNVADSDALVAALWRTAYFARPIANTARKFYFVEDLDYLFFAPGSPAEFAKETYRFGFYGITLGQWIADVLHSEFGMDCTAFGFSYDREIYSPQGHRHPENGKKRVLFYARPATPRRGFEQGILALSLVARTMPETEFVLIGFSPQAIQLPFKAVIPGILSPSELAVWYRSCDLGFVLSHTNLSLLPLEIMACGCPVVSNTGANVEWLLTNDIAQLAPPTPQALAEAIVTLLQNDSLRAAKAAAGLAFAQRTDWTSEIRKIESAFYRGLNIPRPESTT